MLLSQIIEKDGKEPPVYILNQTEKLLSNENQIHSAVLAGTVRDRTAQGQIVTGKWFWTSIKWIFVLNWSVWILDIFIISLDQANVLVCLIWSGPFFQIVKSIKQLIWNAFPVILPINKTGQYQGWTGSRTFVQGPFDIGWRVFQIKIFKKKFNYSVKIIWVRLLSRRSSRMSR